MPEKLTNPELLWTLGFLLSGMAGVAAMVILEKRPKTRLDPSLIPTTPVMLFSGLICLLAAVHLVNLLGVHTGQ
jgi:hypothetical protein